MGCSSTTITYNPCSCVAQTVSVSPCHKPSTNCVLAANYTIRCADSVQPGGTGQVDVSEDSVTTICGGVTWAIVSYDSSFFDSVTISAAGVVEFTISATATPASYGEIVYRVDCTDKTYGALGTVQVCARNLCLQVTCPSGQVCDPLTGLCEDEIPDVILE